MMTSTQKIFFFLTLGAAASYGGDRPKPPECTQECFVEISGLRNVYAPDSRSDVSIHNASKQDLDVNVAVEGLEDGSWKEIVGSVSDPRHSFSKMLRLRLVSPGASLLLPFNPCETSMLVKRGSALGLSNHPCLESTEGSVPAVLRLRVDVYQRGQGTIIQRVRSGEFRLQSKGSSTAQ